MKNFFVKEGASQNPYRQQPQVVVIGNFDGIHLGHQALLKRAKAWGDKLDLPITVVTFDPHPLAILRPPHLRLFDLEDQQHQFETHGMSGVLYLPFSRDFSQLSAAEFLEKVLGPELCPQALVVGFNFRFGSARGGSVELLKEWGERRGTHVEIVQPIQTSAGIVSTSEIRKALSLGNVKKARALLGRPYYLAGLVEYGDSRGQGLGFPTANVHLEKIVHPLLGVYATRTSVGDERFDSVTHLGPLPTFGNEAIRLESHLFDFSRDIYGQKVRVEFFELLRGVQKFSGLDELREQISRDGAKAKQILAELT
ncbi:MAG: riboflavin biosynthesis protein RibF [Bdellovibrio sp.]|jgi:riboflavin kinase/FMN adenylyltransferase